MVAPVSPAELHLFLFGERGRKDEGLVGWIDLYLKSDDDFVADWQGLRGERLPEWIAERPGTRPWAWWAFDAPEPLRRRLGGLGDLHPAYATDSHLGIPTNWVEPWMVEMFNGRRRSPFAECNPPEWREGHFTAVAPDRANPPRFESQATYLDRHGLLTAGERRRLPADAFEPEALAIEDDSTEIEDLR